MKTPLAAFLTFTCLAVATGGVKPPPLEPARVSSRDSVLTVTYNGAPIFTCTVRSPSGGHTVRALEGRDGEKITQTVTFTARSPRERLSIVGTITASGESIPCEADRNGRGIDLVRHSSGLSRSRLNRAVYDRKGDWVLSVDYFADVRILPVLA